MKLFSFMSGGLVDGVAKELANEFAKACPLSGSTGKKDELEKRVEKALSGIFIRAKAFRETHHLGIFKRARLAKKFQDEMLAHGYEADLVNRVTTALVANALSAK